MDVNEIIEQLTEALQQAMEVQDKYSAALDEMDKENKFLADTIVQNQLGRITEERRKLLVKMEQTNASSQKIKSDALAMKSEYGKKLDKITILIQDVKAKQSDIDSYIDSESDAKIADTKKSLNTEYMKKRLELECQYQQKESDCEVKASRFKHFMVTAIIGMVIATVSAFMEIKALLVLVIVDVIVSIWLSFRKRG